MDRRIWIWVRRAERTTSGDRQAGQDENTGGVKDDSRTRGLIHGNDDVIPTKLRKTTGWVGVMRPNARMQEKCSVHV